MGKMSRGGSEQVWRLFVARQVGSGVELPGFPVDHINDQMVRPENGKRGFSVYADNYIVGSISVVQGPVSPLTHENRTASC